MKIKLLLTLLILAKTCCYAQQYHLASPDKKTEINIVFDHGFSYAVRHNGTTVLNTSAIGILIQNKSNVITGSKIINSTTHSENRMVQPVIPEKRKHIPDNY